MAFRSVISDAAATPAISMKRWNAFLMSFSDALLLWRSTTRPNASCSLLVVIVIPLARSRSI